MPVVIAQPFFKPAYDWMLSTTTVTNNSSPAKQYVDSSNNVYYFEQNGSDFGIAIVKVNQSGILVWKKKILSGTSNTIQCRSIRVDSSGNVYVTGYFPISTYNRGFLLKLDSNGNTIFEKNYYVSATNHTYLHCMTIDSADNIYLGGAYVNGPSLIDYYCLLLKVSSVDGTITWQKDFNLISSNSAEEECYSLSIDSSNNIYGLYSFSAAGTPVIFKFNSSGTLQWCKNFYSSSYYVEDVNTKMTVDSSGNVYVTGKFTSASTTPTSEFIFKLNTSGVLQWSRSPQSFPGTFSAYSKFGTSCIDISGNVYHYFSMISASSTYNISILKLTSAGAFSSFKVLRPTSNVGSIDVTHTDYSDHGTFNLNNNARLVFSTFVSTNNMAIFSIPVDGSKDSHVPTYTSYTIDSYSVSVATNNMTIYNVGDIFSTTSVTVVTGSTTVNTTSAITTSTTLIL